MHIKIRLTWASITLNRFSCSFNPLKYLDKLSTLWKQSRHAEQKKNKRKGLKRNPKTQKPHHLLELCPLTCSSVLLRHPRAPYKFCPFEVFLQVFIKQNSTSGTLSCTCCPGTRDKPSQVSAAVQLLARATQPQLMWKWRTAERSLRSSSVPPATNVPSVPNVDWSWEMSHLKLRWGFIFGNWFDI